MTKIKDLCNTQGKRILMEMWRGSKKVAEDDITGFTVSELKEAIRLQEMQGRAWSYRTVNLK